jgi:type III secretion protein V
VRKTLRRYLSHKCTRGSNTLVAYLLDPGGIELRIVEHLKQEHTLDPAELESIRAAIEREADHLAPTVQQPAILTTSTVALFLRRELTTNLPTLPVLSYDELSPDMNIQPLARIMLDSPA